MCQTTAKNKENYKNVNISIVLSVYVNHKNIVTEMSVF